MKRYFLYIISVFSCLLLINYSYGQTNSVLEKKAKILLSKLKSTGEYSSTGKDTMMDLNGDHYIDILIEYYGLAGTGLKNRIEVYLYNHPAKKFTRCEQLCELCNPTFYFNKKIVVGYYIGMSGGDAAKLKWNGLRLDSLEKIEVDIQWKGNEMDCTVTSFDFITKKTSSKVFGQITLPKEYKYFDYTPLIKRVL
jgi:hypothetical protein